MQSSNGNNQPAPAGIRWRAHAPALVGVFAIALILRLLVWRWHEFYPLGGDEQEYFNQALTLLREWRYDELRLMRPPLYTAFLAASILAFDSLVQNLRLVQAILSALTVIPAYLLAWNLFGKRSVALAAAGLTALNYTLAATATELLTETLFLLIAATLFWLLARPGTTPRRAILAGVALGALLLLRSVALPLLALGALWLLLYTNRRVALLFAIATILSVAPWTIRNYLTYHTLILIDTTGAENLWLDNDPAGREAVKAQLYALGGDMAARQRLASERGAAVILADPARFAAKAWGEARRFFALQYFDDLRDRPAIWVPPLQVWLRLLLGDGLWLIILLGGIAGLMLAPAPRWAILLAAPWALYVLLTTLIFHVELRYRLPIYPALIPFAAWTLAGLHERRRQWMLPALLACLGALALTLAHRPYPAEALMLARKHSELWQAERALAAADPRAARDAATIALQLDPRSALARLALARADLADGDRGAALAQLNDALTALPDHAYAHLLRGAILRANGATDTARADLSYETAALDDLQRWAWTAFAPVAPPTEQLDIGGGLDLGYIRGFHPGDNGFRWTSGEAAILLAARPDALLELRLSGDRLPGAPLAAITIMIDGIELRRMILQSGWQTIQTPLPPGVADDGKIVVQLRSDTYRPRAVDRANPDNRALGVAVDAARLVNATP